MVFLENPMISKASISCHFSSVSHNWMILKASISGRFLAMLDHFEVLMISKASKSCDSGTIEQLVCLAF